MVNSGAAVVLTLILSVLVSEPNSYPRFQPGTMAQEGPSISVPQGQAVSLDGLLSPGEWEAAVRFSFSQGAEVHFQRTGKTLAVGVRGNGPGFPHLALVSGDTVWVLHASAALGSIVYVRGESAWNLARNPTWELRDQTQSSAALEARDRYLREEGWVGTTGQMGPKEEAEFLIDTSRFSQESFRLAVAFLPLDSREEPIRWPETASGDIGMRQLMTGPMPETVELATTGWALLDVSKGDEDHLPFPTR